MKIWLLEKLDKVTQNFWYNAQSYQLLTQEYLKVKKIQNISFNKSHTSYQDS